MNSKIDFFENQYWRVMDRRNELKRQFLELLKASPIFVAIALYFVSKINVPFSLSGSSINWYNFFLSLSVLSTFCYIFLVAKGFLLPPKYKIKQSPREFSDYWEELEKHKKEHDISTDMSDYFRECLLEQTISDADENFILNNKQNDLKNFAGYILLTIFCSYIVLLVLLAMR